jgi:integral membrane protein
MPSLRFLRAVSLTEGLSFLLLLLVAMPLKYAWGYPHAVQYLGWAHGALFLTLHGLLLQALVGGVFQPPVKQRRGYHPFNYIILKKIQLKR